MRIASLVAPVATNRSSFKFASILYIVVVPLFDPKILGYILQGSAEAVLITNRRKANAASSFEN